MTKPGKNSNKSRASTPKGAAGAPEAKPAPTAKTQATKADAAAPVPETAGQDRKQAAKPGVIAQTDTGAGSGKAAAARGGQISPVDSSLVGGGDAGRPAAAPKEAPKNEAPKKDPAKQLPEQASRMPKTEKPSAVTDQAGKKADDAAPAAPAPVQNVTVQKTGFWPSLFGGVIAAGLGAGAMFYWSAPQTPQIDPAQIEARAVSAAEAAARQLAPEGLAALQSGLAALEDRLNALPAGGGEDGQAATMAGLSALQEQGARIATLEQGLDSAAQGIAQLQVALNRQASLIEGLGSAGGGGLSADGEAQLQALTAQAAALRDDIRASAEQAQAQIAAAQSEAARLQEAAQDSTKRAQAIAAVAALQAALDRGITAGDAREALAGAGIEAPEALQQNVPSLAQLQAGFGEASRSALRAALRENSAQGGNIVTNFLRAQTGARSLAPREGDDTDAVLSRANAHVEAGDIAAALTEMSALPQVAAVAPVMAGWLASAGAYRDAHAALDDLSAATN